MAKEVKISTEKVKSAITEAVSKANQINRNLGFDSFIVKGKRLFKVSPEGDTSVVTEVEGKIKLAKRRYKIG